MNDIKLKLDENSNGNSNGNGDKKEEEEDKVILPSGEFKNLASLNSLNLSLSEYLEIIPITDGHVVPIKIAAKLKNISEQAIREAIRKGKLKVVKGITLESLNEYKTNKQKKEAGILGGIAKKEKEIESGG